ncbi:hypothetical protein COTS27_00214 [Spirochaetota bacterium]|nr:hypothetical protein COTS27_00214 [Spirochaetota bacterium]
MYAKQVRKFAIKVAERPLPNQPNLLTKEDVSFITRMVNDELAELKAAKTLTDQSDALVDTIYYILHIACKNGINLDPLFEIVHAANMDKVAKGVNRRRSDGKVLKPENWQPPEPKLAHILEKQKIHGSFPYHSG